jgi:hypothetical protein
MLDKVFLGLSVLVQLRLQSTATPGQLTAATEIINVASEDIMLSSWSALVIFLIRDIGKMVVPALFSARDCRDLTTLFFFPVPSLHQPDPKL